MYFLRCETRPFFIHCFYPPDNYFRTFGYGWDKAESSDLPMVGRSERMSENEHITSRIIANEAASPHAFFWSALNRQWTTLVDKSSRSSVFARRRQG